jgi:amidase
VTMRTDEYTKLTAVAIAAGVRKGEIDPLEVTDAAIAAVEAVNSTLNAVIFTDYELARKQAAAVDRKAPLAGVPFLIKDVDVFVSEWRTTHCSRFFADAAPRPDSEIVRRWREAGVIFLGKTNSPEYASDFTTEPRFRGTTRNPYDLSRSTGGSSGGAAAAVASGMVPAAHGSDVGGSIRVPAACCGVFGLKPSRGLNPLGPYFGSDGAGLNCQHVLTRTVRDSAAFLDTTAGSEGGMLFIADRAVSSYLQAANTPPRKLRVALLRRRPDGGMIEKSIDVALQATAGMLRQLGHVVEEQEFPAEVAAAAAGDGWMLLWLMDIAHAIEERTREIGRQPDNNELEPLTRALFKHAHAQSALDFIRARQRAHQASRAMYLAFGDFDLLLTGATATLPPLLGGFVSSGQADMVSAWAAASYGFAPLTEIFNVTGQPAASLPVLATEDGLPAAVQLVAGRGKDHVLLGVAAELEGICNWTARRPPVWPLLDRPT